MNLLATYCLCYCSFYTGWLYWSAYENWSVKECAFVPLGWSLCHSLQKVLRPAGQEGDCMCMEGTGWLKDGELPPEGRGLQYEKDSVESRSVQTPSLMQLGGERGGGRGGRERGGVQGCRTKLLSTHTQSIHLLLLHQLGRVHKLLPVEEDDGCCDGAGYAPEQDVRQRLRPGITWEKETGVKATGALDVHYKFGRTSSRSMFLLL